MKNEKKKQEREELLRKRLLEYSIKIKKEKYYV
ncbi:hypothetical protein M2150_001701 [Lachnospiraceae bacterium PM6-15]